jgi:hypothetical protein
MQVGYNKKSQFDLILDMISPHVCIGTNEFNKTVKNNYKEEFKCD